MRKNKEMTLGHQHSQNFRLRRKKWKKYASCPNKILKIFAFGAKMEEI